jgi:hypothetical protein
MPTVRCNHEDFGFSTTVLSSHHTGVPFPIWICDKTISPQNPEVVVKKKGRRCVFVFQRGWRAGSGCDRLTRVEESKVLSWLHIHTAGIASYWGGGRG